MSSGKTVEQGCHQEPDSGFFPADMNVGPGYFHWKIEKKIEQIEFANCLIPSLLVVFTRQLEILVTTLVEIPFLGSVLLINDN